MRTGTAVLLFAVLVSSTAYGQSRPHPRSASGQLERAMAQLSAADDSIAGIQAMLERDAAVLAKLREARQALEEETQPMTAISVAARRVSEAEQLRPHDYVSHELIPVHSMIQDFQRSSANINLPKLITQLDVATNAASDVVVADVRMMQPVLATMLKMQDALQARVSGLVQAQGRAMEMTARPTRR